VLDFDAQAALDGLKPRPKCAHVILELVHGRFCIRSSHGDKDDLLTLPNVAPDGSKSRLEVLSDGECLAIGYSRELVCLCVPLLPHAFLKYRACRRAVKAVLSPVKREHGGMAGTSEVKKGANP